jgi:hypothetical protein
LDDIPFPTLPASAINKINSIDRDNSNNHNNEDAVVDKIVCDFSFSDGGQFIGCREKLPDEILPSVLELFATLVE